MTAECFLDTNILIYACSAAPEDAGKQRIAEGLILETDFALSAQVLQEFIANALRNKALGISENGIDATLELSNQVQVLPVTRDLVISATQLRRQFQISHWDATIVAAARELGCHTLYSEDLNPGQNYDGVHVINPFL
ncbi:MAG: PIN domain-containing protein [Oceanipulchritudo sp.]